MIKKITTFFLIFACILGMFFPTFTVKAKTLRQYEEELETMYQNQAEYEAQRALARQRAESYQSEITASFAKIEQYGEEIQASRKKIEELNLEIIAKQKEIDDLMAFLQVMEGENAYLEYVFASTTFEDFIYRTAIVEQMSSYNDELIDEMYSLIEENKQLQIEIERKIQEEQVAIEEQKRLLSSINVTISDLDDMYVDVEAQIRGIKEEIQYYKDAGCGLDEDIAECLHIPYASGFFKPVKTGTITSEFGYRTDPFTGEEMVAHKGIDIALPDWSPVYASASGVVGTIVRYASCGGNIVYVKHNVDGQHFTTRYIHLSQINVSTGDVVSINSIVGYSGGGWTASRYGGYDECTTGAHLHFEINYGWLPDESLQPQNPRNYVYFPYRW